VDAIVEAAARILVKRGYANLTTNEVAKRAGVSIGTFYEYFPHKDALVRELLDAHLAQAQDSLAAFDDTLLQAAWRAPLRASIEQFVQAAFELHARDPALHRVLFEEAGRLPSVRARVAGLRTALVARFAQLLAGHPECRVSDAELSARLLVHAVDALVHDWVTRPETAASERPALLRELVHLAHCYCISATAPTGA
jgi:AcrR family transcriptional regulator